MAKKTVQKEVEIVNIDNEEQTLVIIEIAEVANNEQA